MIDILIRGMLGGAMFQLMGSGGKGIFNAINKKIHNSKIDKIKRIIDENEMKDNSMRNVVIDNKFSIEIPTFLSPTSELGDASFQYCNQEVEFYLTVSDQLKSNFISEIEKMRKKSFYDQNESLLHNMATKSLYDVFGKEKVAIGDWQDTEINGNKAITLVAQMNFIKFEVYYKFAFVESDDRFYQIIVWTIVDVASIFDEKMSEIIKSFRKL